MSPDLLQDQAGRFRSQYRTWAALVRFQFIEGGLNFPAEQTTLRLRERQVFGAGLVGVRGALAALHPPGGVDAVLLASALALGVTDLTVAVWDRRLHASVVAAGPTAVACGTEWSSR